MIKELIEDLPKPKLQVGEEFIFKRLKDKDNPFKTDTLPMPITLRIDKSPVNERASYNFSLNYSTSTYLGELPYELAKSNKTFLSSVETITLSNMLEEIAAFIDQ